MPKGIPNQKYTGEFKQMVVETMRRDKLGYNETEKQFGISKDRLRFGERDFHALGMVVE